MRVRIQSGYNAMRDAFKQRPLLSALLSLCFLGLYLLMYMVFLIIFQVAKEMDILVAAMTQVLSYLFLFLFAGSVPFIASTLLQSTDYVLLFASPIAPRAVVAAKLVDATVTNSLQFSVIGIPALIACAITAGMPAIGWLFMPIIIILFALLPALITAFGLLLLLSAVGMRRLRSAITALNAITGTVVCISVFSRFGASKSVNMDFRTIVAEHLKSLTGSAGISSGSPAIWFANIFYAISSHEYTALFGSVVRIVVAVLLLFGACIALGGRLLSAASVADDGDGPGTKRKRSDDEKTTGSAPRAPHSPVISIARKDLAFALRDTVLVSQTAMPMILYVVPFILTASDRSLRDAVAPLAVIMIGVILYMQTSILSLSSIGLEGPAFWILKCSTIPMRSVLWAKFLWSTAISGGSAVALVLFTAALFGLSGFATVAICSIFAISAAGLCGIGVGVSASFPKFFYDNPALRVSATALILGFVISNLYMLFTGGVVLAMYFLTLQTGMFNPGIVYAAGTLLIVIGTVVSIAIPIGAGAARLELYPWNP